MRAATCFTFIYILLLLGVLENQIIVLNLFPKKQVSPKVNEDERIWELENEIDGNVSRDAINLEHYVFVTG